MLYVCSVVFSTDHYNEDHINHRGFRTNLKAELVYLTVTLYVSVHDCKRSFFLLLYTIQGDPKRLSLVICL